MHPDGTGNNSVFKTSVTNKTPKRRQLE